MSVTDARRFAAAAATDHTHIGIIKFFGGEPFMNLDAIEAAIEVFDAAASAGELDTRPEYGCVTNMTIATARVLALIKNHDFYVTGSIDGPEDVHDAFRVYGDGRGSWKVVDRNIRRMQAETGNPRSLEAVFGPEHLRRGYTLIDIHQYLIDSYAPENVIIHVMSREGAVADLPGWEEFYEAVRPLWFDYGQYVVANASHRTCSSLAAEMVKNMRKQTRADTHCSLGVQTQTVTADGVLYPCYTLIGQDEWRMQDDVTKKVTGDDGYARTQLRLVETRKSTNPMCQGCEVQTTCQACPGMWQHVNGEIDAVDRSHCASHIGLTEGVLTALATARRDPALWPVVAQALGG